MNQPQLYPFEWLAVLAFCFLVIVMSIVSYVKDVDIPYYTGPSADSIDVTVRGAVANPGTITLPKGSLLVHALEYIELLPESDQSKLKLEKKLRQGQVIVIPSHLIRVTVTGAVLQPTTYSLPKKTKIKDLEYLVELHPNADRIFFKSKRQMRDNEVLDVPFKN